MEQTRKRLSFDSKCYDLAEHFYPDWDERALNDLAQEIQDVVEAAGESDDPREMGWVGDDGLP